MPLYRTDAARQSDRGYAPDWELIPCPAVKNGTGARRWDALHDKFLYVFKGGPCGAAAPAA
jgi:hypothetical protein